MIRDTAAADLDTVLALNLEAERFLSPLDRARLERLHAQAACLRVLEDEGRVAAFLLAFREGADYDSVNYRWFAGRYASFLYVDRVVVAQGQQGKGHGARMYQDLFKLARAAGVDTIACEFDIAPPNEASRLFHQRFGFREVGQQQVAGGKKRVSLQVASSAGP